MFKRLLSTSSAFLTLFTLGFLAQAQVVGNVEKIEGQLNKLGYLAKALKHPGLTERMIYGTDWPLQSFPLVSPWYHVNHIGIKNAWRVSRFKNKWDRDIKLKEAFGVPHAAFIRKLGMLNPKVIGSNPRRPTN